MVTYRLMNGNDLLPLYECFLKAFADYQVDMQMSQELFEQRLVRDGVRLEISPGAFDEAGQMIGFYMNGLGTWQGKQTAYDAGTGVVPEYRGQSVAKDLFAFMAPRLQENSVSHYLLEVLSNNDRAVSLYRKLGFVETRMLAVLRAAEIRAVGDVEGVAIGRIERADWTLFESFWDGYPSWQNSIAAVERVVNQREMLGAFVNGTCVGYGVVFRPAGTLMQLAVAREYRRRGIGSRLLSALTADESLKVNNVDEKLEGTLAFFEANGFKVTMKQFEMVKIL